MWTLHVTGDATLPQQCGRCNQVIISDEKDGDGVVKSDPLPANQPVYVNDRPVGPEGGYEPDGTIASTLPWGQNAPPCKAG